MCGAHQLDRLRGVAHRRKRHVQADAQDEATLSVGAETDAAVDTDIAGIHLGPSGDHTKGALKASGVSDGEQLLWVGAPSLSTHLGWQAQIYLKDTIAGLPMALGTPTRDVCLCGVDGIWHGNLLVLWDQNDGGDLGLMLEARGRGSDVARQRRRKLAYLPYPMSEDLWTAVDGYIVEHLLTPDSALDAAVAASEAAGLPPIAITPNQGKLLELLARIHNAQSILELGTLGGYSTIWLARALPEGGRLVTLEREPRYAEVAGANIAGAGLADMVQIRVGPALETLPELYAEGSGPFDLIFIDADKQNYPGYLEWSLKLSRVGTLIVGDNVVRAGAILEKNPSVEDGGIAAGVRRFYKLLAADPRVSATAIQTVGAKGHDGFALALVTAL